ncbi:MAG: divergent polysaccharide deacetylase family protein [Alphaproteobacteria bacterium]|nr:divergent polysaccharide deacetylase family protein [Alphaproteobacteria bacterium]
MGEQAALATLAGHELLAHVPMEPESAREDPGPQALLRHLPAEQNLRRLRRNLAQFAGYVGINNHMGSRFSADAASMDLIMQELKVRGLLFLDSRTSVQSLGRQSAERHGVPNAVRNVFLDNDHDAGRIRRQIETLESEARHYGCAVGIGHPHPATLEELERWLPTLAARGFQLVPVSAIVDRRIQLAGKP